MKKTVRGEESTKRHYGIVRKVPSLRNNLWTRLDTNTVYESITSLRSRGRSKRDIHRSSK